MEHPLRILVVEDEPLVREVIGSICGRTSTRSRRRATGAKDWRDTRLGGFDLVLTDRAMPEMNGDVLAAEIKKINPRQPVILLTGFGDLMRGAGEKPEGVDLVVSKPFTLNSLREAMYRVVRAQE